VSVPIAAHGTVESQRHPPIMNIPTHGKEKKHPAVRSPLDLDDDFLTARRVAQLNLFLFSTFLMYIYANVRVHQPKKI
jgi:hypothetical protein